jgi:hypothetical protein
MTGLNHTRGMDRCDVEKSRGAGGWELRQIYDSLEVIRLSPLLVINNAALGATNDSRLDSSRALVAR